MEQRVGGVSSMSEWLPIAGVVGEDVIRAAKRLATDDEVRRRERLHSIRKELHATAAAGRTTTQLAGSVTIHVLLDLVGQGWAVRVARGTVSLRPPDAVQPSKEHVQRVHLLERDAQLRDVRTREFVDRMERRRLTSKGWHSIFSVMRD